VELIGRLVNVMKTLVSAAALSVSGLRVRFADQVVVDDVDIDIGTGECVGLIGESGSGKTTIALAVLGLLPTGAHVTGSITVDGHEIVGSADRRLRGMRGRRVAYVGQDAVASLNPLATVGYQLGLPLRRHRGLSRRASSTAAGALLEQVDLPASLLRAYPTQLSGGQRQRVAIALAIACQPALLIADEPTTALDVTTQAGILTLLRDLPGRDPATTSSLLLISHDIAAVSQVCPRLTVLRYGRVVEQGPATRVLAEPAHPYTRDLVAAAAALDLAS
jgi:peptide/nickel transport system ATP-binding protein